MAGTLLDRVRALVGAAGRDRPDALDVCDAVGAGAVVRGRPHVENLGRMTIGDRLALDATPVATHLVTGPDGALEIGSDVRIGHGAGLVAHAHVRVGDGASIGAFTMVLDTDFHVAGARDARPTAKPIDIGAGAVLGHHVTVLRGSAIGAGARVAPGSVVSGVIDAGASVSGVPARPIGAAIPADGAPADATVDAVLAVVGRAIGSVTPLAPELRIAAIARWDSLAALNVLLSLESAFAVELRPEEMARAHTLGELAALVRAAAERGA